LYVLMIRPKSTQCKVSPNDDDVDTDRNTHISSN
jgi:hypothetical protein